MTTFLFSLILTSWFKVAETGLTINGTLDSTTVIKKPYISTITKFKLTTIHDFTVNIVTSFRSITFHGM